MVPSPVLPSYGCRVPRVGLARSLCGGAGSQSPWALPSRPTTPPPLLLHPPLPPHTPRPSLHHTLSIHLSLAIHHLAVPHPLHPTTPGTNRATSMGIYPGNSMALLTMIGNHGQRASSRWGAVWLVSLHYRLARPACGSPVSVGGWCGVGGCLAATSVSEHTHWLANPSLSQYYI